MTDKFVPIHPILDPALKANIVGLFVMSGVAGAVYLLHNNQDTTIQFKSLGPVFTANELATAARKLYKELEIVPVPTKPDLVEAIVTKSVGNPDVMLGFFKLIFTTAKQWQPH